MIQKKRIETDSYSNVKNYNQDSEKKKMTQKE